MEMNKEQLDLLKEKELELLRGFIQVCEQLRLKYYVIGGTLLGAVRHQGFIPWDDDIDVGMPRADYEIFLRQGQALLPAHFFIQSLHSDPSFCNNFAKLRNSNTTFIECNAKNCRINHGIFIDIFPLDFYPRKDRIFAVKKLLLTLRISDAFCNNHLKWKGKLLRCFSRLLYPRIDKAAQKREQLFRSVTSGDRLANHCGIWGVREIVPTDWYGDGVSLPFEGIPVLAPVHHHKWLTRVYGDYMQFPPEEKRIPHHYVEAFDPDRPYTCYTGTPSGCKTEPQRP